MAHTGAYIIAGLGTIITAGVSILIIRGPRDFRFLEPLIPWSLGGDVFGTSGGNRSGNVGLLVRWKSFLLRRGRSASGECYLGLKFKFHSQGTEIDRVH